MDRSELLLFAEENKIHTQIQSFDHGEEIWLSCDYEFVNGMGEFEKIGVWKKRISLQEKSAGQWVAFFSQAGETRELSGSEVQYFVLEWKDSKRGDFSYAEQFIR
ncbi:MAG: hypothetical protein P8179_09205 [Candidatus Thiodiazotropha sp.]